MPETSTSSDIQPATTGEGSYGNTGFDGNAQSLPATLWRFKWLVVLMTLVGGGLGYWTYSQKPTKYESASQLMFKSDQPLKLDTATGTILGGMPSGGLMKVLITSDIIIQRVVKDPDFLNTSSLSEMNEQQLINIASKGVRFRTVTDETDSRERMIASISFEHGDPDVCKAAVESFNNAIEQHFEAERKSSVKEFQDLIETAKGKLEPTQEALEDEYKAFRQKNMLELGPDGQTINPYRERQFLLETQRIASEQRLRELKNELDFATKTVDKHRDDPEMVAEIIGHAVGDGVAMSLRDNVNTRPATEVADDLVLQRLEVERALLPLRLKRDRLEAEYGASHPQVRDVATQVESTERQLNDLNERIKERKDQLESESEQIDFGAIARKARIEQANRIVNSYIDGLERRGVLAQIELDDLDEKIAKQKQLAGDLKKAEDADAGYKRRLANGQRMIDQLYQQLSALNLVDASGGIMVEPVLATSEAYVTGPDLKKDLIFYGMGGLAIGALLAMAIEASAKMFRSAEEIQRELRVPVITHIPVDEGKLPKGKTETTSGVNSLDPKLSVVHRPYSPAAEAVRAIRTSLLFDRRQHDSKVFLITSPLPGDGKSTVAANVACSLAQSGKSCILIDLDLRSPRLSLRFNLQTESGLTNVLNGELGPAEATHETPIENLDIMPCGPLPSNPAEALTLIELGEVFEWAKQNYEFVIVDTPPLLMVSDPTVVTTHVDASLLVTRVRRRSKPNCREAVSMLRSAGARVMGVIVNKVDELSGSSSYEISASGSYQSIGYGYGDKYRKRYQQEADVKDDYIVKGRSAFGSSSSRSRRNGVTVNKVTVNNVTLNGHVHNNGTETVIDDDIIDVPSPKADYLENDQ